MSKTSKHHPLRFLKGLLTNRFAWSILLILIEIALLVLFCLLLYRYFFPITLIAVILSIGVTFYMLSYYQNLEMRLLWVFIVMCLPIVGPFLFIILALNGRNKPLRAKSASLHAAAAKFYPKNPSLSALKHENHLAYLQANYICTSNHISLSTGNRTTYYPSGEQLFQDLLADLKTAKKFIFLEFFIIRPGQIWDSVLKILKDKVKNGVEVYLMYDDIGSLFTVPANFYKEVQKHGINCIPSNKFNSRLNGFHNNRDHRKVVVIDGKIGYTGGINLADEYANTVVRFGHWKDSGVRLEGPVVTNLLTLFLCSWNLHSKTPLDFSKYQSATPPQFSDQPGYSVVFGSGPTPIYDRTIAKNVYLNIINSSSQRLYITTPYLICDREILDALTLAAEKGVDVRIITPSIPDKKIAFFLTRSNYAHLIKHGVKIYEYTPGFIHAKNLICDDKLGICGTVNLDFRSTIYHFECAAWFYNTPCLKPMADDFEATLKISRLITPEAATLKRPVRIIAEILKVFAPLF